MKRRGLYFPDFGQLNHWRSPDVLIWGVIGCGLIMSWFHRREFDWSASTACLYCLTIYFITGHCNCLLLFREKETTKGHPGFRLCDDRISADFLAGGHLFRPFRHVDQF
jgi:hypothetical protein